MLCTFPISCSKLFTRHTGLGYAHGYGFRSGVSPLPLVRGGLVVVPHNSFFSGGDFRGQSVVLTVTELMYESLGKVFFRYLLPSLWIRPWSGDSPWPLKI